MMMREKGNSLSSRVFFLIIVRTKKLAIYMNSKSIDITKAVSKSQSRWT